METFEFIDGLQVVELDGEPCVELDDGWVPVWEYERRMLEDTWTDYDERMWQEYCEMQNEMEQGYYV